MGPGIGLKFARSTKKVLVRRRGWARGWADDKTPVAWADGALGGAISHAIGFDFPHTCGSNDAKEAQVNALDGIFGTHTPRPSMADLRFVYA